MQFFHFGTGNQLIQQINSGYCMQYSDSVERVFVSHDIITQENYQRYSAILSCTPNGATTALADFALTWGSIEIAGTTYWGFYCYLSSLYTQVSGPMACNLVVSNLTQVIVSQTFSIMVNAASSSTDWSDSINQAQWKELMNYVSGLKIPNLGTVNFVLGTSGSIIDNYYGSANAGAYYFTDRNGVPYLLFVSYASGTTTQSLYYVGANTITTSSRTYVSAWGSWSTSSGYLPLAGGTMLGPVNFGNYSSTWVNGTNSAVMNPTYLEFATSAGTTMYEYGEILFNGFAFALPAITEDSILATQEWVKSKNFPAVVTGSYFESIVLGFSSTNVGYYSISDNSSNAFIKGNTYYLGSDGTPIIYNELYVRNQETNLINKNASVSGKYVNGTTGNLSSSSSWTASGFIPVVAGSHYFWYGIFNGAYYAYYDSKLAFISGGSTLGSLTNPFLVPSGASYIRVSVNAVGFPTGSYIFNSLVPNLPSYATSLNITNISEDSSVTQSNLSFSQHDISTNFIDKTKIISGWYVDGGVNGALKTSGSLKVTPYIEVVGGSSYYYSNLLKGYYAFYDENHVYISGHGNDNSLTNPFAVPSGAKYARFTYSTDETPSESWISPYWKKPNDYSYALQNCSVTQNSTVNPCDYKGEEARIFHKGLAIGDSTTIGVFNHNETGTLEYYTNSLYSYPTYFEKMTGTTLTNMGIGGDSSVQWWNANQSTDFSGNDFAIISLGINDVGQGVSSADTQTAFQNIINALKNANNNIKIFITTITPAYSYGNTTYVTINALIATIVSNNTNCYLIDLTTYGHAQKGTAFAAGHLSALGYLRQAEDIKNAMSYIIATNLSDFYQVQFIGTTYSYAK